MCHPVFIQDLPQLPALPMFLPHPGSPHLPSAKCPPSHHKETQPVATLPTHIHVETHQTSRLSIFPTPPSPVNNYPYYKRPQLCHYPQVPPYRSLHHGHRISINQATQPGGGRIQVGCKQASKTPPTTTSPTLQSHPSTMQSPYPTQTRQPQGGPHSRQGGGHGSYGSTGLQQQGPGTSTRDQHIQSSP